MCCILRGERGEALGWEWAVRSGGGQGSSQLTWVITVIMITSSGTSLVMLSNTPAHQPWYWHQCSITVDLANLKSHHISKQLRQPKAGPVLCKYKEPHNMVMAIKIPSRSLALELDKCGVFSSSSFITRIKTCLRTCLRWEWGVWLVITMSLSSWGWQSETSDNESLGPWAANMCQSWGPPYRHI